MISVDPPESDRDRSIALRSTIDFTRYTQESTRLATTSVRINFTALAAGRSSAQLEFRVLRPHDARGMDMPRAFR